MLALVLVVSDCVDDNDAKADPDERPAPTTTTTLSPEQEVEQAYKDFIAMVTRIYLAPDPNDPEIAERSTGEARANFEATLMRMQSEGTVIRIGQEDRQTILSTAISGDSATLSVCFVDQSGTFDAATSAEVEAMRTVTTLDETTLLRQGGMWRVSRITNQPGNMWEGEYSCGV
jgi:hypothetical protein